MSEIIKNRYEFTVLFEVENGNPNGDPDAGNMPRADAETNYGIVTDVCLKRKIRNYVETVKEDSTGYRIYIKDGVPLNQSDQEDYEYLGVDEKEANKQKGEIDDKIQEFIYKNFFDIRTFGAVMTTFVKAKLNCGQVRGPFSLGFIVFKHSNALGNCPAYRLFEAIKVHKKETVVAPRSFQDYVVTVEEEEIPPDVEMKRMI